MCPANYGRHLSGWNRSPRSDSELVQLHLQSVSPITVAGPGHDLWDLIITEDGVQSLGNLDLTANTFNPGPSGDMEVQDLPVQFQIEFVESIGSGGFSALGGTGGGPGITGGSASAGPVLSGLTLNFENAGGSFALNVEVPAMGLFGPIVVALVIAVGFAWFVRRRYQSA